MRLSEKTIEVNFCTQMAAEIDPAVWWFGLTQKEEAKYGWDVAGTLRGRWVMFQLKASNKVLHSGLRQFRAPHDQLLALKDRATTRGAVFYVLPAIGTIDDLMQIGFRLLPNLRFLDVSDIPHDVGPPTKGNSAALRKDEMHYLDLDAIKNVVTIHSDPVDVRVLDARRAIARMVEFDPESFTISGDDALGRQDVVNEARRFIASGRNRVAAFIPYNRT